jgi:Na+-transporting NADH:ubiquinone oxidoreductase subunit NqrD
VSHIAAFGRFWWNFVVGDDWLAALGVIAGLALTALLAAWWVMPIAVAIVLTMSVLREAR